MPCLAGDAEKKRAIVLSRLRVLILETVVLFVLTAFTEIVGCYLPYLWLKALTVWDITGASVALAGMAIIVWGGWRV